MPRQVHKSTAKRQRTSRRSSRPRTSRQPRRFTATWRAPRTRPTFSSCSTRWPTSSSRTTSEDAVSTELFHVTRLSHHPTPPLSADGFCLETRRPQQQPNDEWSFVVIIRPPSIFRLNWKHIGRKSFYLIFPYLSISSIVSIPPPVCARHSSRFCWFSCSFLPTTSIGRRSSSYALRPHKQKQLSVPEPPFENPPLWSIFERKDRVWLGSPSDERALSDRFPNQTQLRPYAWWIFECID